MTGPSVADLLAIAPRPELFSAAALARALNIGWKRAAELKALAMQQTAATDAPTYDLMHALGINRAEAEAYIKLQRSTRA
ncbi:hypothetical protein DYQ93_11670 [Xanthomonas sp. LMG 8992]|uniref:hypothetical protein n=1 Tax=Xanthomonas sp. LMG 8992 TaxID=1591157 RepID=UPI00136D8BBF|nr:hypothetical protein [Xanthomonas sp. LMG 8992]MXV11679.1 hypothetical protein [Xanthomonas sp. LMG 8992]